MFFSCVADIQVGYKHTIEKTYSQKFQTIFLLTIIFFTVWTRCNEWTQLKKYSKLFSYLERIDVMWESWNIISFIVQIVYANKVYHFWIGKAEKGHKFQLASVSMCKRKIHNYKVSWIWHVFLTKNSAVFFVNYVLSDDDEK